MKGTDYVPGPDEKFDVWVKHLTEYVEEKCSDTPPQWPHIPVGAYTAQIARVAIWDAAYHAALNDPTPAKNKEKRRVRKETESMTRAFVQKYLYDEHVTDLDRDNMRIPNRSSTRTPIGDPVTVPMYVKIEQLPDNRLRVSYRNETEEKSQKIPYGMGGCLLRTALSDGPIKDVRMLKDTQLMTRSPYIVILPPEARGKTLSMVMQWQSKRGILGPHSEIRHVVIGGVE